MQLNQSAAGHQEPPDECRLSILCHFHCRLPLFSSEPELQPPGNHNVDILIEDMAVTCHNTSSHPYTRCTFGPNSRKGHGCTYIYSWRQTAKGKLDCSCNCCCCRRCRNKILNSNENTIDLLSFGFVFSFIVASTEILNTHTHCHSGTMWHLNVATKLRRSDDSPIFWAWKVHALFAYFMPLWGGTAATGNRMAKCKQTCNKSFLNNSKSGRPTGILARATKHISESMCRLKSNQKLL